MSPVIYFYISRLYYEYKSKSKSKEEIIVIKTNQG